jgi:hypothetical protein
MATYTLISSNVLASSAASVTFSSIPATYTDLILRVSAQTNRTTYADYLLMTVNSISSGYSETQLQGQGSTASSSNASASPVFGYTNSLEVNGVSGSSASNFGSMEIYMPSYTASQNKPMSVTSMVENNSATQNYVTTSAFLLASTAAITSITLACNSSYQFSIGSSFYLYGISNA